MNPLVTLELARLDVDERRRQADAWRRASGDRPPVRVRLGAALLLLGARVSGDAARGAADSVPTRRTPVRVP